MKKAIIILSSLQAISLLAYLMFLVVYLIQKPFYAPVGALAVFTPTACIPVSLLCVGIGVYAIYNEKKKYESDKKHLKWYWIFTISSVALMVINIIYSAWLFDMLGSA